MGQAQQRGDFETRKHQAQVRENLTLDATADAIVERVGEFMGECLADEKFAAWCVDEKRSPEGKLLYLRLVPCDLRGSEPARRWPKSE